MILEMKAINRLNELLKNLDQKINEFENLKYEIDEIHDNLCCVNDCDIVQYQLGEDVVDINGNNGIIIDAGLDSEGDISYLVDFNGVRRIISEYNLHEA